MNEPYRPDPKNLQRKFAKQDAQGNFITNGVQEAMAVIREAGGFVEPIHGVIHMKGEITPEIVDAIQFLCDIWGYHQSKTSTKI